ncbi:Steroid 17-alpha-hydroxylase 17-20 [Brachionus plicatilis]|uniref:Steroid 17-alpha-hydroxylase 17-20 n=1 Tax=Brachionus plicatilis TaxID=10195 RepID=A0A3M7S921_BRAPC|nr:Steroid 17-alpha-hydroxylase 17-20 [Brachionus plicatilis]
MDSNGLTSELIKYKGDIDIKDDIVSEIFEITEILEFDTSLTIQEACASKIYKIKDVIRFYSLSPLAPFARRDERNYINQCASEAEEASSKWDLHKQHKITNTICSSSQKRTTLVKDKEGRTLTTEKEQEQRWVEHFRPEPIESLEPDAASTDLDINTKVPSLK